MTNSAIIALGTNIEPEAYIDAALKAIEQAFTLKKKSSFVYTAPVGYRPQPDFLNGAALIKTTMTRPEITAHLKRIEDQLGRDRTRPKDGPRRIDLDLIVFNGQIIDEDVYKRDFLQRSIHELQPKLKYE